MYVNTGGGGKAQQQQQTLQNQTNASVRHNNPYTHSHTQHTSPQQAQYEHHQGPVTFVTYPFCNVTPATHGVATGGNGVGAQAGHVIYQTPHPTQTQPQPHSSQQQVGLHNAEQTLHYFTKSAPMPAHHMHHPSQQHSQIRNMITAVSHQRQPYMLSPNYFALSHAIQVLQQPRPSLIPNAAAPHTVATASGGSLATQLQNSAPRSIPSSGPTAYVPPPYCTPPLLLSAAPTAVNPHPSPMLTAAPGIGQPPTLHAYSHMDGGIATGSNSQINMSAVGLGVGVGVSSNTEHTTTTKQRKHAIPIINPDTLEIVTFEHLAESPKKSQQTKSEINVELISIKTDSKKSSNASLQIDSDNSSNTAKVNDPIDAVVAPPRSQSIIATDTDKVDHQIQNNDDTEDDNGDENVKEASDLAIETTNVSNLVANTTTHSCSESPKVGSFEDPNDTDADTNEHELDTEDEVPDTIDGLCSVASIDQESSVNLLSEGEIIEVIPSNDLVAIQKSDSEHSSETEVKSKHGPCTNPLEMKEEDDEEIKSKDTQEDVEPLVSSIIVSDSKRGRKSKKPSKRKQKQQKKLNQQQKISNNDESEKVAHNTLIRYSLEELKAFAKSPESRKTPVVPCQKGDCISQLFVARQQHHHLTHQVSQNLNTINLQHHVQQSYHHINFNESIEFVTGKRRVGGGTTRKHHDNHSITASTGNINISGVSIAPASSASGGASANQNQKKLPVIQINLSLNEKIILSKCENAWQPKFLTNNSHTTEPGKNNNDDEDIEIVLKKVRGILNKLTAENFDALLKEMTSVTINTQEKMQKVMLLIFEKTVSEPNFAPTYAKFSKVLFEEVKAESKKLFNTLLITRLQTEFELNVNNADAKDQKLQEIINKMNETTNQQDRIELQAELDHQEYQFRRRAWGTVRFIGEMYKMHSLSADRVLQCVESLLRHENEEKLEYMCKLLTTVGGLLEGSDRESFSNNLRMNNIFTKIQTIIKEARDPNNKKTKICSRVRFMLQDLIDLRSKNWGQTSNAASTHVAPRRRHIEERNSSFCTGSMQRMLYGGNNNRHNETRTKESSGSGGGNYFVQKPPKSQYLGQREQQSIDFKKLNFSRGDESSQLTTKLPKFFGNTTPE